MWCARTNFVIDCRIWPRFLGSKVIFSIALIRRYRPTRRAFESEAGPLVRNGLASERPQHVTFRGGQSGRCRTRRRKMHIEALHEIQRRTVVNLPQR